MLFPPLFSCNGATQVTDIFCLILILHHLCASQSTQLRYLDRKTTSGSGIKKRHVPGVNMSTTKAPTTQSKADARTVARHEVFEWQLDNRYILSGYRPAKADYLEIFNSLTFLHNETCNVYTHLIGALLLPLIATAFMRALHGSQFFNVSGADYVMLGIFFWCAECCLASSAGYHLMGSHSHNVEQFWHGLDLLGIVIVTVATFVSGIYYIFFCEPSLQRLHWAIVSPSKHQPPPSPPSPQPGSTSCVMLT